MLRNRWMSFATIFVISIVFTISSFFIALAVMSQKAVRFYEKKAQVIIFFKNDTPEKEIFAVRDKINDPEIIEEIKYTSKEDALEIYKEDFKDDPDLVETVTSDSLPPSLDIRAKSIDDLSTVIKRINREKDINPYIDDVMYFKDVVDKLKSTSKFINYATIILIASLSIITFSLIIITIGFNIMSHKNEIEIMHLVGSPDSFIKTPFILEGSLYGIIGGMISASILLVPWYVGMSYIKGSTMHYWLSQTLDQLSLGYLKSFNVPFTLVFFALQILIGLVIGSIGSSLAVIKYLNLKEK